jgi:hypothetical protein
MVLSNLQGNFTINLFVYESSLTTFAKSDLEYLIRYRSIPTPDLYFDYIAASTLSASYQGFHNCINI